MAATSNNPGAASPPSGAVPPRELRGIKPPVEIPNAWLWAIWIAAGLILAAVVFWLIRRQRRRQAAAAFVPPVPAHVRARQKLDEALRLIEEPKPFCTLVSDTIREYLEERFTFHAPDRTTEEFLNELRDTDLLTPDQKESLGEFLQQCDLVKFACYEPTVVELRGLHESGVRLVSETEPELFLEPAAAAGNERPVATT
jgi:hypothetical protein